MVVDEVARYRLVITYKHSWWVAALRGPALPDAGAIVRRRTLAGCELAGCALCPDAGRAATIDVLYDFGIYTLDGAAAFRLARLGNAWQLLAV